MADLPPELITWPMWESYYRAHSDDAGNAEAHMDTLLRARLRELLRSEEAVDCLRSWTPPREERDALANLAYWLCGPEEDANG